MSDNAYQRYIGVDWTDYPDSMYPSGAFRSAALPPGGHRCTRPYRQARSPPPASP